jgi:hypothetical protein
MKTAKIIWIIYPSNFIAMDFSLSLTHFLLHTHILIIICIINSSSGSSSSRVWMSRVKQFWSSFFGSTSAFIPCLILRCLSFIVERALACVWEWWGGETEKKATKWKNKFIGNVYGWKLYKYIHKYMHEKNAMQWGEFKFKFMLLCLSCLFSLSHSLGRILDCSAQLIA